MLNVFKGTPKLLFTTLTSPKFVAVIGTAIAVVKLAAAINDLIDAPQQKKRIG
jgi:hypothetical protein